MEQLSLLQMCLMMPENGREILTTQVWPQVYFQSNGEGRPALKGYLKDVKKGRVHDVLG